MNNVCPNCKAQIKDTDYFCPNCGKKIKDAPIVMTTGKKISIYLLSVLLPPLGLWPGVRYIRQKDQKVKTVGIIAIVLTILSTVVTIWLSFGIMSSVNKNITKQIDQYQNAGF